MTTIDLEFEHDASGNRLIKNTVFERQEFVSLTLRKLSTPTKLQDVRFLNCRSRAAAVVRKGVELENVTFHNLDCGDTLFISSESIVNNITVSGSRPKELLIEPQEPDTYVSPERHDSDILVDVADFEGHVVIIGFPGRNIRKNERRHVTIKSTWIDLIDWKKLGLAPVSFWRVNLKKLSLCNASEGVFGLPNPNDTKRYQKVLKERELLESLGIVFD